MDSKKRINLHFLLFFVFLAALWRYGADSLWGPVLFSDEYGYWAGAAWLMGKDWSQVTSTGYYYSYGYSFLLWAVMAIAKNPVTAYKMGTACNVLLLFLALMGLYWLLRRLFTGIAKEKAAFFCFAAVCCPANIFYMQMTLPEVLLICILPFTALLLYEYFKRPHYCTALMLAACLVYMYFVHMRTVGFLLAAVLTVILSGGRFRKQRKKGICFLVMTGLFLFLGYWGKNAFTKSFYQYASASGLAVNDYAGQLEKLAGLFSKDGLVQLIAGVSGKLFYLGSVSFGLFFSALGFLWKKGKCLWNSAEEPGESGKGLVCFYLLAGIVLQLLISVVFTITGERIDYLLYGRYNEIFLPLTVVLGIANLTEAAGYFRKWLLFAGIQGAFALCLYLFITDRGITQIYGYFVTGISYVLNGSDTAKAYIIWIIYGAGCAGAAFLMLLLSLWDRVKGSFAAAGTLAVIWTGTALLACNLYIYPHNQENKEDIRLCGNIAELEAMGKEVCFINSPGVEYVGLLQYMLGDTSIQVISREQAIQEPVQDRVILIYKENEDGKILEQYFEDCKESSHFLLYYKLS